MLVVPLVAEPQDPALLLRQTAEERGVQQQGIVAVPLAVFCRERNPRVSITEKNRLARLEDGHPLAVDAGRVEEERRTCRAGHLDDALARDFFDLVGSQHVRRTLAVASP